ncbi:hypothetical protein Patl1_02652 [Pistacia atlantica]|uniref:Uncharacterized protein n=1 Tax=Pistacia atlantica TaxID=434234 RepID=A0ACC1C614_9ROSI|nr:hypothetical protein Patl1_02652 [Pistacia atlantica]
MYSLLYLCRDLSFNNLTGPIPKTFNQLAKVDFMYLMGNMLTGVVPKYILESNKIVDVSYNNFTWESSGPIECPRGSVSRVHSCLKHNFPCSASSGQSSMQKLLYAIDTSFIKFVHKSSSELSILTDRYSMHINCGGKELNIGNTKYEADIEAKGASMFYTGPGQYWAFSSTGNFMDNDVVSDVYIQTNTSALSNVSADSSELYRTARVSPLSLTYYGLCLGNGNYTVKLHFAEIIFTNYSSLNSLGRRIFDVYIQGKLVLKHFSIQDEAGGTGIPIVKNFTAPVTSNTLKIQFYWAGRGTTGIPVRGFYGPIISAISVDPSKLLISLSFFLAVARLLNFKPPVLNGKKHCVMVVAGTLASSLLLVLLLLLILRRKGWLGGNVSVDKGNQNKRTQGQPAKEMPPAKKNSRRFYRMQSPYLLI